MKGNKAFISIITLFVMAIILIFATFLLYISKLEYQILSSRIKSIQAYYLAEGKVYKLLYKDKYYKEEILPRIETYLTLGALGGKYDSKIELDKEDLVDGDSFKNVEVSFLTQNDRKLMVIDAKSKFDGVDTWVKAEVNIIKDIYEMNVPILYNGSLKDADLKEYLLYMDYVAEEIVLPVSSNKIMGIEFTDVDSVFIYKDSQGGNYIECYRDNIENPISKQYLKDDIFLILREPASLFIGVEKGEKIILNGVIYTEGDIVLNGDLEFNGILIMNSAHISIPSDSSLKSDGIILAKDWPFKTLDEVERAEINYNMDKVKNKGIHIPGFIHTKIKLIKGAI